MDQKSLNYERIAMAIDFITQNVKQQPDLETIAEKVSLSPFHFQRLFQEWAGVSPKKFLQFLTLGYAKQLLRGQGNPTLPEIAFEAGLSGTGRLHDLFVSLEGMTPDEYKNGGKKLVISYSVQGSVFGYYLVASTEKGICDLHFFDGDPAGSILLLKQQWPQATLVEGTDGHQEQVARFFDKQLPPNEKLKLHLKGTPFQVKVWEALLKIPEGQLTLMVLVCNEDRREMRLYRAPGFTNGSNLWLYIFTDLNNRLSHRVLNSQILFESTRCSYPIGGAACP